MLYRRFSQVTLSVALLLTPLRLEAEPSAPETTKASEAPLPDLPKPPPRAPRTPTASELQALDDLLGNLRSNDAQARDQGRTALTRIDESVIPAIAERLRRSSESMNKLAMKALLERIRRESRDDVRAEPETASRDYLEILLERAEPQNENWKNLVSVLGMSRMLDTAGTVEAARELIGIYVRFGEFLRIDTQLQLEKLGDGSIAALIEATQHQAPKIAEWAKKRLSLMGKSDPAEVVQIENPTLLGDILRAYGSTRDPEVARLIISFSSSEHAEVRRAARQAVSLLGEVANWPLRDTYEKLTGKRPFREWSWDRCARELFRELDRSRLANVYLTYQTALTERSQGKLDQMRAHFDEVLAQDPSFESTGEMAAGYLEYARHQKNAPNDAIAALERAERLAVDSAVRDEAQSLRLTLEGERLLARGLADQMLFRRALHLDPKNQAAKEQLERIESLGSATPSILQRYLAVGAIGLLTLIAAIYLLKPQASPNPSRSDSTPQPPEGTPPAGSAES